MNITLTTCNTETLGALAMSGQPTYVRLVVPVAPVQGTGVSVVKSGSTVPAHDNSIGDARFGRRITGTAVTLFIIDVAHPRLEGPPV